MTVALTVLDSPDEADKQICLPIATEATFKTLWIKGAESLGLNWLPLFQTGIPLEAADKDYILSELGQFEDWLQSENIDSAEKSRIKQRIHLFTSKIQELYLKSDKIKIYIG